MWAKKLRVLFDKMVGSNQTLIALRMVRSKLRKREESNHNPGPNRMVHPQDGAKVLNGQSNLVNGVGLATALEAGAVVVTTATTTAVPVAMAPAPQSDSSAGEEDSGEEKDAPLEFVLWSSPTTPSTCGTQLSLYSGDQDTLVHNLPYEEPGECKHGFKKNLQGKWKRLVKKKQVGPDVFSIPPELRDQLKQIYVY